MPLSASSAVVVEAAIESCTRVESRRSGRAKTTAMMTTAGASTRMTSSRSGLSRKSTTIEPMRLSTDESNEVSVCVSIVRTWVTSLERREISSPTRRRT